MFTVHGDYSRYALFGVHDYPSFLMFVQVEECLKNALLNHKIVSAECAHEVAQIIEEAEVDIEADPLLERACALDLLKYCKDLEHGAGRRKGSFLYYKA